MAELNESQPGRKHRVIHWNPEAGQEPARRRWTWWRILGWSVGGFFGLLIVAGLLIRGARLVFGQDLFRPQQTVSVAGGGAAPVQVDPNAAFVSQSKAELSRETASKALAQLSKLPNDHPRQFENLILLEKSFQVGDGLLRSRDFGRAFAHFEGLNKEIDEFARSVKAKGEAQVAYDTILVKTKDLEKARSLAPEALDKAFSAAGEGRKFMSEGSFLAAKKTFDQGFAELKKAEDALAAHVEGNLVKGQKAILAGQRAEAETAFKAALEKSPGNEIALQGMKRAENADRVFALLAQAKEFEAQAKYAQAAEAFDKAFALDAFSATAQQGKARAARLEKETKFDTAFTAAKEALARKEWGAAVAASQEALKVYPKKPEVEAILKSARENSHRDAVQAAISKAFAFENKFQWNEARASYYETLQLEADHVDAKEGYVRTGRVIRTLLEYNKLIELAEQKASRAEFQTAIKDFNKAMSLKPEYLQASERVAQLRDLLLSQNQPVEVTFNGDGKTWISITNFRMLGQATPQTVKILPGDYEVVGRRKGYKDVLLLLQVRNGTPPPVVSVACSLKQDKI